MAAHQRIGQATRLLLLAAFLVPSAALAQQTAAPPPAASDDTLDLAKKTQNPIADLISLPLQNNLNFGYGAKDAPEPSSTQYVLNIQPVVPIKVTKELNLITRPIIPVIRQPDLIDGGETWGLADIELQTYLSPSGSDKVTWGRPGPPVPERDQRQKARHGEMERRARAGRADPAGQLGDRGPGQQSVVLRRRQRPRGRQPHDRPALRELQLPERLVRVDLADHHRQLGGRRSDDTWTVPLGGGFGRLMRFGKQPVNLQAQAFYNVVKPDDDADRRLDAAAPGSVPVPGMRRQHAAWTEQFAKRRASWAPARSDNARRCHRLVMNQALVGQAKGGDHR